jgi:hypothetical protein
MTRRQEDGLLILTRQRSARGMAASLVALLLGSVAIPASAQSISLRPRWETGQVCYVELQEDVRQTITGGSVGPQGMKTTISNIFCVEQTVRQSAGGRTKFRFRFDRIGQTIASPFLALSYDSDLDIKDQTGVLGAVWSPVLGQSLEAQLENGSEVTWFEGMEGIARKVEKSIRHDPPAQAMFDRLRYHFDDAGHRVMWCDQRFLLYPESEVRVGESWSRTTIQQRPTRRVRYDCTLKEITESNGRAFAVVSYVVIMTEPAGAVADALPSGASMRFGDGKISGVGLYDMNVGHFIRQTESGEMSLILQIAEGEKGKATELRVHNEIQLAMEVMSPEKRQEQRKAAKVQKRPMPDPEEIEAGGPPGHVKP